MNVRTTLSLSEARKKIFTIADEVQHPNTYYTLTENGCPKVVMMSAEEFESWQETLEVMKDFPHLKKDIEEAQNSYKKGDYVTLETYLSQQGYVLSDNKKSYGVSPRRSKKSSKRSRKN